MIQMFPLLHQLTCLPDHHFHLPGIYKNSRLVHCYSSRFLKHRKAIGKPANAATIAFLAQHESYDIGQLGFLKKYNTNDAMAYT